MTTVSATGYSRRMDSYRAGVEAAQMALNQEATPNQILLLSSVVHNPTDVLAGVRSIVPNVPIVGGSSFGEITNYGMRNHSVALMAIRSDDVQFQMTVGHGEPGDDPNPGYLAATQAQAVIEMKKNVSDTQMGLFWSEMLGNEKTLHNIQGVLGKKQLLFGGCCSGNRYASIRDRDFVLGYQYVNDHVYKHSVPLLLLTGNYQAAFGVSHGWRSYGPVERIGRCEGNIIYEIGDMCAAEFYERYLGKGAYTPYPLAFLENDKLVLRAVTGTAKGGGLTFTTGVPKGTAVRITRGSRKDILTSAREATQEALNQLGNRKPKFGIIVSCISRHMMLGSRVHRELEAVQEVLGKQLPLVGFYAAGEYSPVGDVCFYHNLTFCICLITDTTETSCSETTTNELERPVELTDSTRVLLLGSASESAKSLGGSLVPDNYTFVHQEDIDNLVTHLRRFMPHVVLTETIREDLFKQIHTFDSAVQIVLLIKEDQFDETVTNFGPLQDKHENLFSIAPLSKSASNLKLLIDSASKMYKKSDECQLLQDDLQESKRMLRHSEESIESTETMLTESYKTVEGANETLERNMDELKAAYQNLEQTHVKLRDAQQQLLDASRRAGMADIAAEVLHHVGNDLNSLTVSLDTIMEGLSNSRLKMLRPSVDLLISQADDLTRFVQEDNRGKNLLPYLNELTTRLLVEQEKAISECIDTQRQVDNVLRAVNKQQERARGGTYSEACTASQIIEESIRFVQESFNMNNVALKIECAEDIEMTVDRHRIIQILISLLSNAEQAVSTSDTSEGLVTLSVVTEGEEKVAISVTDNGIGIEKELQQKIFTKGFSTKSDHQGFGLHDAANAANAMGGGVVCASDGEGRGSVFTVVIPRHILIE